jgi:hypothetical protein
MEAREAELTEARAAREEIEKQLLEQSDRMKSLLVSTKELDITN